jgi:hypothetical protein
MNWTHTGRVFRQACGAIAEIILKRPSGEEFTITFFQHATPLEVADDGVDHLPCSYHP